MAPVYSPFAHHTRHIVDCNTHRWPIVNPAKPVQAPWTPARASLPAGGSGGVSFFLFLILLITAPYRLPHSRPTTIAYSRPAGWRQCSTHQRQALFFGGRGVTQCAEYDMVLLLQVESFHHRSARPHPSKSGSLGLRQGADRHVHVRPAAHRVHPDHQRLVRP